MFFWTTFRSRGTVCQTFLLIENNISRNRCFSLSISGTSLTTCESCRQAINSDQQQFNGQIACQRCGKLFTATLHAVCSSSVRLSCVVCSKKGMFILVFISLGMLIYAFCLSRFIDLDAASSSSTQVQHHKSNTSRVSIKKRSKGTQC